jgi:hypothetical protein
MQDEKRVAVTLVNGRSHILRIPEDVTAVEASEALAGVRAADELGWEGANAEWLPAERGDVWVRKSAIAEIAVIDYPEDPSEALGLGY